MTVTILTCTARTEPHFDWLADSICNSELVSEIALEWVVIDAKLWTEPEARRATLTDAVKGRLQVIHLPPKPCRWQGPYRLTKSDYFALNNARNTGLIVARGERVVLLDDCTVVDKYWLQHHGSVAERYGVAGTYRTYRKARVENGAVIDGDDGPYGWDKRREVAPQLCPTNGGWGFGLNTSFPLSAAMACNGFDELYDGQAGSEDSDFGVRCERAGLPYLWDPGCIIYQILETHEAVFEHVAWNMPEVPRRKPKELRVRRDNQFHFANEVLVERLCLDEITRFLPLGNEFSLTDARQKWEKTREMPVIDFDRLDWRDGQPLGEMT